MGDQAAELRPVFARRLGLAEDAIPWHAARDRVVDLGHALSQLAGAADASRGGDPPAGHGGRGALGAADGGPRRLLDDAAEAQPDDERVPRRAARLLRATVSAPAGRPAHASERDMARWGVEWLAVPQAVVLAGGVADKLAQVLEGLVVDEARMRENLDATGGQIMAEAVMMRLAERSATRAPTTFVMAACRRAAAGGGSLADELLADESLGLDRAQVDALLDPAGTSG